MGVYMGPFSLSWKGILLHMQTLFQEAGGPDAITLLDTVSTIPASQRELFLKAANKIAKSVADNATLNSEEATQEAMIERLCNEIITQSKNPSPKLSVISGGGKTSPKKNDSISKLPVRPVVQ